ncbi:MAG: hypothetical protein WCI11_02915 [Candidatus Methylumidiphilus sp.]
MNTHELENNKGAAFPLSDGLGSQILEISASRLAHLELVEKEAAIFFAWFNRNYPFPSNHINHPWIKLGEALDEA